jgi:hypothetical protein
VDSIHGGWLLALAAYVSLIVTAKSPRLVSSSGVSVSEILSLLLPSAFVLSIVNFNGYSDILR